MSAALLAHLLLQPIAIAPQSARRPGGPSAARIGELWDFMYVLGTAITLVVFAVLAWAIFRPRPAERGPAEADRPADTRGERLNDESGGRGTTERGRPRSERIGVRVMVWAGIVFPAVVLGFLLVYVMHVQDAISLPSHAQGATMAQPAPGEILVEVTGRQYWWQVNYLDADPRRSFLTANEIRIPVGRPVVVRLVSGDVIHSFWVPGLQGKMDLVPGRTNALAIEADRPGRWRGQCAEFCGVQHAKMAFTVVAMPPDEYEAWAARQRQVAPVPQDSATLADQQVFLRSACATCHMVRGTPARATVGPDLTHVASRLTLAAGTLPNTPGHRYGWIADPQGVKPGSLMPRVPLTASELHAIVRYLGTLE